MGGLGVDAAPDAAKERDGGRTQAEAGDRLPHLVALQAGLGRALLE